jgi:hypothetical protein
VICWRDEKNMVGKVYDTRQRVEWNGGVMVTEIDNDQRRGGAHDAKIHGNTPLLSTGVIKSRSTIEFPSIRMTKRQAISPGSPSERP